MTDDQKLGKKIFYTAVVVSAFVLFVFGFSLYWFVSTYVPNGPVAALTYKKLGESAAVIHWETKFPAKTKLEYGTSEIYPNSLIVSDAYALDGRQSILALLPGRKHVFRIVAEDKTGKTHVSPFYNLD